MAYRQDSDIANTLGDVELGGSIDCDRRRLSDGFTNESPDGMRSRRTGQNGDDHLDYELPRERDRDSNFPMAADDWEAYQQAQDYERMQGGFLERPGLDDDYSRANIKRN